jgi:outer membrane protein OmpA-like peptidoglycan-associated protein
MSLRNRFVLVTAILLVSSALAAAELPLTALIIPDGKTIELNFTRTSRAPSRASMAATIKMEKTQASIDLRFEKMEPAVLFAGDISTYVLWAVAIDGSADNLGELFVDKKDCSATQPFFTTKKIFALILTAEPHAASIRPTEYVLFTSGSVGGMSDVKNTPFTFRNFQTGPKPALESIAGFQYSDDIPVTFKQAQKVVEVAEKMNAAEVNANAMHDAKIALANADNSVRARANKRQIIDYSRVAVQMASQAIRDTVRANEAKAAAEAEAKRKAEKAALDARAKEAESEADRIARELKEVEAEKITLAEQSKDLAAQRDIFAAERDRVAADRDKVAAERDAVAAEREAIKQERDELAGMLKGALSTVAETNETARGVIVSLPGILFDVNKATLQIPAQLTVAKLAGILMVFQNMDLSIEGYTDSTGSDELNMALSTARAKAVYDFLKAQGIAESRMKYQGFGPASPVAPNDTEVNRAKNRRVEVVLTQAAKK